jgi:hypothetical protein
MDTKGSYFLLILAVILAIFFCRFHIEHEWSLVIFNKSKSEKIVVPVKSKNFTITFVHSIERTPVSEIYSIDEDGKIILNEVRFYSLGTGLPFSSDGTFKNENGQFVIKEKKSFSSLLLRVSPIPGHALIAEGRKINFLEIAESEDLLEIRAQKRWVVVRR